MINLIRRTTKTLHTTTNNRSIQPKTVWKKKALLHPFKAHLITISRGDALPDLLGRLKIIYHHHVLVNEGKQIHDASKYYWIFFVFLSSQFFYSFISSFGLLKNNRAVCQNLITAIVIFDHLQTIPLSFAFLLCWHF